MHRGRAAGSCTWSAKACGRVTCRCRPHSCSGCRTCCSARGWPADPQANAGRPLLVAPSGRGQDAVRLAPRGLYRRLKRVFVAAANALQGEGRARDAAHLARASTHWLRHTFGSEAVAAGVPLDVVRENLGHASLATTSIYLHPTVARRMRELARMAGPNALRPDG